MRAANVPSNNLSAGTQRTAADQAVGIARPIGDISSLPTLTERPFSDPRPCHSRSSRPWRYREGGQGKMRVAGCDTGGCPAGSLRMGGVERTLVDQTRVEPDLFRMVHATRE